MCFMCLTGKASAQGNDNRDGTSIPSLALHSAVAALKDPTTYAPAGMLYVSSQLDWNSSQAFFQRGDVEENPRYTVTGLPHDTPLSYGAGNQQLVADALSVASVSLVNNAIAHFTIDALALRNPEHRKLWKTIGWIERAAVASSLSYLLSVRHFEQWQQNERMAAQRGY
jgi:hypothetical protein